MVLQISEQGLTAPTPEALRRPGLMRITQHLRGGGVSVAARPNSARLAIGLYRVSTAEQGQSGLGLEAQRASVRAFVGAQGWQLVGEFEDVALGKDDSRPGFQEALALCR